MLMLRLVMVPTGSALLRCSRVNSESNVCEQAMPIADAAFAHMFLSCSKTQVVSEIGIRASG